MCAMAIMLMGIQLNWMRRHGIIWYASTYNDILQKSKYPLNPFNMNTFAASVRYALRVKHTMRVRSIDAKGIATQ